ncbi:hypothetical protein AB0D08_04735 [Kitasatospora sp. NPDC048540]|uniref:hypothetical protein n=1 Tax=unclassified Kitasatospora TaxID=2633591 RepID=UPI00053B7321|nr:hypothetical protein [Kitasatospora sp. MBT63]
MTKIPALAALSLAAVAVAAAPAHAEQARDYSQGASADEVCHQELAQYPVVGPAAERTTGVCGTVGRVLDRPPVSVS